MKKRNWTGALALLLALVLPVVGLASDGFGAAAVKEGEAYTVEQMLTYAIQDEYLARAEYQAIIAQFGVDRPFTNIMKAEGFHVEHLLPLFAAHNVPVPADTASENVVLPAALEDIYQVGVTAEVNNIAMYETFLKQEGLPEDVKGVFLALKRASENHLAAFQRNLDKASAGQANRGGRWADDGTSETYGYRNRVDDSAQTWNGRGRPGN